MLGGSIAGYASPGHDGKLFVSTMLPAALLLLTRGVRDGRLWAWGAAGARDGARGAVAAPAAVPVHAARRPARSRCTSRSPSIRRTGGCRATSPSIASALALGAVLLGVAISAIQYMPLVRVQAVVAARGGARLRHGRELLVSYRGNAERLLAAVLRHPRQLLGPQRHPLSQRLSSASSCCCSFGAGVRRVPAARLPALLARRRAGSRCSGRTAATRRSSAFRSPSCRARNTSARRARSSSSRRSRSR